MAQVYFFRHGIAADRDLYENDHDRPLTPKGIEKTQNIAQRLVLLGLQFDRLLTSPLLRARQTAEILHELQLAPNPEIFPALAPDGEMTTWLAWWNHQHQAHKPDPQAGEIRAIALVGHQPDLGHWAEALVWGEAQGKLIVKKAGIIGVELPTPALQPVQPGAGELFWLAPPRLLLS